jgi:hypothetical protein
MSSFKECGNFLHNVFVIDLHTARGYSIPLLLSRCRLAISVTHNFAKNRSQAGTDVMILKIFSPKNFAKNWRL